MENRKQRNGTKWNPFPKLEQDAFNSSFWVSPSLLWVPRVAGKSEAERQLRVISQGRDILVNPGLALSPEVIQIQLSSQQRCWMEGSLSGGFSAAVYSTVPPCFLSGNFYCLSCLNHSEQEERSLPLLWLTLWIKKKGGGGVSSPYAVQGGTILNYFFLVVHRGGSLQSTAATAPGHKPGGSGMASKKDGK